MDNESYRCSGSFDIHFGSVKNGSINQLGGQIKRSLGKRWLNEVVRWHMNYLVWWSRMEGDVAALRRPEWGNIRPEKTCARCAAEWISGSLDDRQFGAGYAIHPLKMITPATRYCRSNRMVICRNMPALHGGISVFSFLDDYVFSSKFQTQKQT